MTGQKLNDPRLEKAQALRNEGNNVEATKIVQEVLQENLQNPQALQILGQLSHDERNFDVARDLFRESLKLDETQGHVWNDLGQVLNDLRKTEEAEIALKKALALNPTLGQAYKNLAVISLNRGDKEEGLEYARKALEINPTQIGIYMVMAKAKAFAVNDPIVRKLEKLLVVYKDNRPTLSMLHYTLSYIYEQAGDGKKFFEHLNKANDFSRDTTVDWKKTFTKRVENIKKIHTREFLDSTVPEEFKVYTPIFIVGMPRSGTSLTDQIFATHSQCFGGDELQYFSKYLQRICLSVAGDPGLVSMEKLSQDHFNQLATLYQRRVQQLAPGMPFISDKMPWNFQLLGTISKVMPWAKIIHIYRDPLDCGFSCYRNPLPLDLQFTTNMEDYAFYRSKYQELMDFWQEVCPDRFINLSYEEMVDQPEKELRRVLDYVGLPWEDEVLNFHKTKRQVRTISSDQVNKPLNKSGIGKAGKYEKELAPMIAALKGYGLM